MKFPERFFITGTDTNVGKTIVSAMLTMGLQAAYWKPIQSGIDPRTDRELVKQLTGLPDHHFIPEAYCLSQPLSPHAAAEHDKVSICLDNILWPAKANAFPHVIVEGAGGIMVPLNEKHLMIDLIKHLNIPVVVVCRTTLGTINHSLLTLAQLRQAHIPIFGVILNGLKNASNRNAIAHYGDVKILAELEPQANLIPEVLLKLFSSNFTS